MTRKDWHASERGFSLVEMLVVVGLIGVASAVAVPIFLESNARSSLWTNSERIGSIIRQTRLKAITPRARNKARKTAGGIAPTWRRLATDADKVGVPKAWLEPFPPLSAPQQ